MNRLDLPGHVKHICFSPLASCYAWQTIMEDKVLSLRGIVGLYPASSHGDDIHVYTDESRGEVAATFYGLRQQAEKDNDEPYMSISDFIAPEASGVPDYLGLFANGCFGVEEMIKPFKAQVTLQCARAGGRFLSGACHASVLGVKCSLRWQSEAERCSAFQRLGKASFVLSVQSA